MLEPRLPRQAPVLKYLSRDSNRGEQRKMPKPGEGDAEGKDNGFPATDGCLMIFGAYKSRCR
jgi:hypothetical protein